MWPSPVKAREWGSRNQQFNSAHPDHFIKDSYERGDMEDKSGQKNGTFI